MVFINFFYYLVLWYIFSVDFDNDREGDELINKVKIDDVNKLTSVVTDNIMEVILPAANDMDTRYSIIINEIIIISISV